MAQEASDNGVSATTAKELVDLINAAQIYSPYSIRDKIDIGGATEVTTVGHYEHRWYTTATVVYQIGDEFFGVFGPISLKSENMDFGDVGLTCKAFEMEQVLSVTYQAKEGTNND